MLDSDRGFSGLAQLAAAAIAALCAYIVLAPALCGVECLDFDEPHPVFLAVLGIGGAIVARELWRELRPPAP